ncbi:MAG TPA: histidine kinase [Usitatibacter sp.]|nr:histidine kinase [Usitatibacter sp.]
MRTFLFIAGHTIRWTLLGVLLAIVLKATAFLHSRDDSMLGILVPLGMFVGLATAYSHVLRVRLVATRSTFASLGNRHRRQVEIPFAPGEAFAIVEAAIRELPQVENVESAADSLQVRARVAPQKGKRPVRRRARRNVVLATITPGDDTCSLTLVCHPEGPLWLDWFVLDHGANLENVEALVRAVTHRIAARRKGEKAEARETATEKELAVARLSLLHAQVEPHFLYNTLASAQVLTRADPAKAEQMLGHLIQYLRHSLPSAEEAMSTLGEELARTKAYLEILRIRMGERLRLDIQVPEPLRGTPMPPMMLQTLVENAVKHGLEPLPGGGTIWILARPADGKVCVSVADDGRGFSEGTSGTGVGLRNVRERLRLAYGDAASFSIAANFPRGVNATLVIPA